MRHFHVLRNREHCPIVNLDKIWSMMPEGTLEKAKAAGGKAPVIDVTESVSFFFCGVAIDVTPPWACRSCGLGQTATGLVRLFFMPEYAVISACVCTLALILVAAPSCLRRDSKYIIYST